MNIYEYTITQQHALDQAEQLDGELTPDLIKLFDQLDLEREEIIDLMHRKIKNNLAMVASIKKEADQLKAKSAQINIQIDKDIGILNDFLQPEIKSGVSKLARSIGDIKFTGKGGGIVLKDNIKPEQLPVEFQNIKISADLTAIGKQLEVREDLQEYCYRSEKFKSVSIKNNG